MISAFAYTFWDKNYRVKSPRKIYIYIYTYIFIFIYCYLFFLARDVTKKVKDSVVFGKAYVEPIIGHNC